MWILELNSFQGFTTYGDGISSSERWGSSGHIMDHGQGSKDHITFCPLDVITFYQV